MSPEAREILSAVRDLCAAAQGAHPMNVVEVDLRELPKGVRLHLAASGQSAVRYFHVRPDRRGSVLSYEGLPRIGEAHPEHTDLECHALIPGKRPTRGVSRVEVWALYRPRRGQAVA